MADRCFDLTELDDLLELEPDDPRREHLGRCPLCSARVEAFKVFLSNQPTPGSRPEEARATLERFVAQLISPEPIARKIVAARRPPWPLRTLRRRWVAVPAMAVATVIVLYLTWAPGRGPETPSGRLRMEPTTTATELLVLENGKAREDGSISLRWRGVPEATGYRVQLLDAGLDEVASFETGADTALVLLPGRLPRLPGPILWRVQALLDGGEIAHSRPVTLDLRRP